MRLEELLISIKGVGNVKVMITLKSTLEKVILNQVAYDKTDENTTDSSGSSSVKNTYSQDSVVVYEEDADGNKIPYILKEKVPEIEGIAVIADGGSDSENILKITSVTQALFGISSHKISVIGMR